MRIRIPNQFVLELIRNADDFEILELPLLDNLDDPKWFVRLKERETQIEKLLIAV